MQKLVGFLRLMRLANVITAVSDIMAGIAIAGYFNTMDGHINSFQPAALLIIATVGLYGGGVVFNDVFDAELDKVERPERPIPSGLISKGAAAFFASLLIIMGIAAAAMIHPEGLFSVSGLIAVAIAVAAIVYDKWGKHYAVLGPLNMGLCRGLNLLLGMSILPEVLSQYWYISLVPIVYIAAITMISRGEVHGSSRSTLYGAVALYGIVIASILAVAFTNNNLWYVVCFLLLLALMIFPPLQKAIREPKGPLIGKAVKAGVIALIVMNAAWAAAFGTIYYALLILLLLPVSIWLAKLFAVT
ncbi:UbiA-like protein EboC [Chitinophagaceae bacterium LB-8]|uniref:UbiA-like protein EboC n=1 Tax=Paraflavisolibacter caeni TaxID=2982496 RepID=A0A9X2XW01_9BACT|nr:UbiA-like protein EboC [Paraflavisolibacter caeni]MCU7549940.1 UbiA-like protein EboC [Paraflavisolibacter caeni]